MRKNRHFLRTLAMGMVFVLGVTLTHAHTKEESEALEKISNYLNSFKTMHGEFVQIDTKGYKSEGLFFVEKPGKIRFHYKDPVTFDIISDGKSVSIRNRKKATNDIYPLSKTPLKFMLRETVSLQSDKGVKSIVIDPDFVRLVLFEDTIFGDNTITLFFDASTLELKHWSVSDGQGNHTSVSISNVILNETQAKRLFVIDYRENSYNKSRR